MCEFADESDFREEGSDCNSWDSWIERVDRNDGHSGEYKLCKIGAVC